MLSDNGAPLNLHGAPGRGKRQRELELGRFSRNVKTISRAKNLGCFENHEIMRVIHSLCYFQRNIGLSHNFRFSETTLFIDKTNIYILIIIICNYLCRNK